MSIFKLEESFTQNVLMTTSRAKNSIVNTSFKLQKSLKISNKLLKYARTCKTMFVCETVY